MSIELSEHQQRIVDNIYTFDWKKPFFLGGYGGTGKQLHEDSEIKTPKGSVKIKDIRVGDEVFTQDGSITKVTGFFPQGIKPAYKITFRDKTEVICGAEHQWAVISRKKHKKLSVVTTQKMLDTGILYGKDVYKYKVPMCEPVRYSEKEYFIDPYVLGVILGDGSTCGNCPFISFFTEDLDIRDKVERLINKKGFSILRTRYTSERCIQVNIGTPNTYRNSFMAEIRRLGLDVRSGDKFIPQEYLLGSVEQRVELLRGLMDTDGSCRKNRTSFSSTSKRLAQGISELAQSLGNVAILRTEDRTHEGKGLCYEVNLRMFFNPFSCKRKSERWSYSTKNPPSKYIHSIERVEDANQYCISVSHPSELYLTNGFTVTHNTTLMANLVEDNHHKYIFLAPTNKAAQVLKSKLPPHAEVSTVHSVLYSPVAINEKYKKQLRDSIQEGGEFAEFAKRRLEEIESDNIQVEFYEKDVDLENKVVVVDESSMVGKQEFDLLCRHAEKIVFVGDPFQIPPVKSTMMFPNKIEDFDGFLTEVHRAALESPITRLSMELREDRFSGWKYWANEIPMHEKANFEILSSVDQIICGTNKVRHSINKFMRKKIRNTEDYQPHIGDKVIIKENIRYGKGLIYACNGDIGTVTRLYDKETRPMMENTLFNGEKKYFAYHNDLFSSNYGIEVSNVPRLISSGKTRNYGVDYAYAITVHSSQGSEWDNVLFYDDGMMRNNPVERRRFMYTAITRAKKNLVIVRGG